MNQVVFTKTKDVISTLITDRLLMFINFVCQDACMF